MNKKTNEQGIISYEYQCPIATYDQWPPQMVSEEGVSIWNSLDANPSKIASYHGYSYEAIDKALEKWEHQGSGILMSPRECELFKDEVLLWCQVERQTWTFKKTLVRIYGLVEGIGEQLGETDEGEG